MNDILYAVLSPSIPPLPRHEQGVWELYCCTEGKGRFLFDGTELAYQAGDLVIIPPGTAHAHQSEKSVCCYCLYIADAALSFRHPQAFRDDANHSLQRLFQDALYHFGTEEDARAPLLAAYGQLIMQHLSLRRPASPKTQLVEDIAQNIMQNFANPNYELDELIKSAPYCYDYLCRLFRQELHTTPHKYLTDLRLQSAAGALRLNPGNSMSEIARMCGYSDPLYFSRMFKKKFGVSPREYAKVK